VKTQDIVEEYLEHFKVLHALEQGKSMDKLMKHYLKNLKEKEKLNGGFPDTDAMKIALFGQVAFKFEQSCQDVYNRVQE